MAPRSRTRRFRNVRVRPVFDNSYDRVAADMIASAERRCLCRMFIVDVTPHRRRFLVDDLLRALKSALKRGVDVRIVVSGSNDTLRILETSAAARARLEELGVPLRWAAKSRASNHSKVLLCDDRILIGSHNWSADAFRGSTQDSVLVSSADLCGAMAASFDQAWKTYVS